MAKGGPELLQDPVAQELLASRIPARLAYVWTDGTPRVVSIWFHWDGTDLLMGPLPGAPKLKALHTGDRVAITIDTNDPPHHVLSIRGTAQVTEAKGVVPEYAQAAVRWRLVGPPWHQRWDRVVVGWDCDWHKKHWRQHW